MEKKHILLLITFTFFVPKHIDSAKDDCLPAFCGPHEPEVRFPFRIIGRQPDRCGFPGFDLSCNKQNKTIIRLPSTHSYIVNAISYVSQVIYLDPEFCLPNRIADFNITDPPFVDTELNAVSFFNCSSQNFSFLDPYVSYPCLSSANYSVIAVLFEFVILDSPLNCKTMKTIMVPVGDYSSDIREGFQLRWTTPDCRSCEMKGKSCRMNSDDRRTTCSSSRGISRSVKYGLSIGLGVPGLICIIGLIRYASSEVQGHNNSQNQSINLSSVAIIRQTASRTGLDGPTIESYPITVLLDSCSLPSGDDTCAICLCDYKPSDSLRTIPECCHYFHAGCIAEWLKLNGTCPVCRKKTRKFGVGPSLF